MGDFWKSSNNKKISHILWNAADFLIIAYLTLAFHNPNGRILLFPMISISSALICLIMIVNMRLIYLLCIRLILYQSLI